MRAKTLLTILFLLSLGVAAWLFLHALPQNATADVQPTPKEEVLVAAGPLAAGTLLRSEDVVWRPAAGVVEPGTVVRPLAAVHTERDEQARNEVSGAALNVDLARGEPIRRSLIVKPGDREFLQVVLTSGPRDRNPDLLGRGRHGPPQSGRPRRCRPDAELQFGRAGAPLGQRDDRAEPPHAGHRPAERAGRPFGHARSDPRAGGEGRRRGRARQIVAAAAPCRRYRAGQRHSGQPRPPDLGRRRVPRLGNDQAGR